jgi:hypothetical protein
MTFPFAEAIAAQPGPDCVSRQPCRHLHYGGAACGGKTAGPILKPLRHVGRIANFAAVFFQRTMPQINHQSWSALG